MRALVLPLPSWLSEGDSGSSAGFSVGSLSEVRFLASAGREGCVESYGDMVKEEVPTASSGPA